MLETLTCSAVLMLLYGVLFDRRVSFAFCRAYLPVSVVAAAVIPLLRIPVWSAVTEPLGGNIVAGEIVSTLVVEGHATAAVGVREILLIVYAGGVVCRLRQWPCSCVIYGAWPAAANSCASAIPVSYARRNA